MKSRILSIVTTLLLALFLVSCTPEEITPDKTEYTISFVTNGGSPIDSFKFEDSFDANNLRNYTTTRTNYDFVSWHTESSLLDESLAAGVYNKSTTFYAKWEKTELEVETYTIKFLNYDDTLLLELTVEEDVIPVFTGNNPIKPNSDTHEFSFKGWDKELSLATKDETYKAVFNEEAIEIFYTIKFINHDDTLLEELEVKAGELPVFTKDNPTKASTDTHEFSFKGWDKELSLATKDETYKAVFNEEAIKAYYTIKFINWDNTLLLELEVEEGSLPVYNAATPTKPFDDPYRYEFKGWDSDVEKATANKIYQATFTEINTNAFNPEALNNIIGFDLYSLLPKIVSFNYYIDEWPANDDEIALEINLFDWDYNDALNYYAALDDLNYPFDEYEEAFYIGGAYVFVYFDNTVNPNEFGLGIYRYLDEEMPEPPVDGVYYSFNMQDIIGLEDYNYASNVDIDVTPKHPTNLLTLKVSQVMNIASTATPPGGLTTGVVFAASTDGNNLAYFEIDTKDTIIGSISFEMLAETNYANRLIDAYVLVYNDNNEVIDTINFYDEIAATHKTITINNINASHFKVAFKGTGQSGNSGRFMIYNVNLFEGESIDLTFEEGLDKIGEKFNDINFPTYFPILASTSNVKINELTSFKYKLTADFDEEDKAQAITNYHNELLNYNFFLNEDESLDLEEEVYSYMVDEDSYYHIYLKVVNNKIEAVFYLTTKAEAVKLESFKSINEYQLETFGYSGLPSLGSLDVLVIPVEIKGDPFDNNHLGRLNTVFNGNTMETGWESVSSYYEKSSYGKLNLNFDIYQGKYQTVYNASHYELYEDYGDIEIIEEAVDYLDPSIDFSKYDFNNDGIIDSVIFIYSKEYSELDPWWAWVYLPEDEIILDNKELGYYMWASYDFMDDELNDNVLFNAETYIHEMGHLFGLNDYYHNDYEVGALGGFDMMDLNMGDHGPLNKLLLGWVGPTLLSQGEHEITTDSFALYEEGMDQVFIIPKDYNNFDSIYGHDEYLVIMYYEPKGLYDAHLIYEGTLNDSGIVTYQVNAKLASNGDYWDMFKYDNMSDPNNFFIKLLSVEQNKFPSNNPIDSSDILTSGSFNIRNTSYKWEDKSSINVEIEALSLINDKASIRVNIN